VGGLEKGVRRRRFLSKTVIDPRKKEEIREKEIHLVSNKICRGTKRYKSLRGVKCVPRKEVSLPSYEGKKNQIAARSKTLTIGGGKAGGKPGELPAIFLVDGGKESST